MRKIFFRLWWSSPLILVSVMFADQGFANEVADRRIQAPSASQITSINQLKKPPNSIDNNMQPFLAEDALAQVTSVSQLSDVRPTDWAFQALQSLVERYGCIAGYPDRTYRGNRAMTRYEFAAGLNACLDRVNELIAVATSDLVKKEDLATIQKLQEEFAAELATLRGRVDTLEARTTTLEKQQFSTTTKLFGEAIFSVAGVNSGDRAVSANLPEGDEFGIENGRGRRDSNIAFSDRIRLNLISSFTGRDRLYLRLQAANTPELQDATGTRFGRLAYEEEGNNNIDLTVAEYRFPIGERINVAIAARDELYRFLEADVEAVSPLEGDNEGSITKFGRFNPIFRLGGERVSGASVSYDFSSALRLTAAYLSGTGGNNPQFGLFNDANIALANLTVRPLSNFTLGLTYVRSYSPNLADEDRSVIDFEANSKASINPFPTLGGTGATGNHFGINFNYRLSPSFIVAGWYNFATLRNLAPTNDRANTRNWAVELAFPDVGKDGSLLAFVVGQLPKVTSNTFGQLGLGGAEPDTSWHFEAFYRYRLTDNISVTPGIIYITNPENNRANDNLLIGVIRTSFFF
ncbi:S-layer region-like protein (plasmid) [Leptolyngbya sp. NIES-3755]|nr:S-layer region-like protein [Leptolyngbya sp. NIES-3755]